MRASIGFMLCTWAGAVFAQTDFRGLGLLPDAPYNNSLAAMSDDGRTVIVQGRPSPQVGNWHASAWTPQSGFTPLDRGADGVHCTVTGISSDGGHVAGTITLSSGARNVVRWASSGAIVRTYGTTGAVNSDFPFGPLVSGDGNVITCGREPPGNRDAFRWTEAQGFVPIHGNTGNNVITLGISQNGGLIFGANTSVLAEEHPTYRGWSGHPRTDCALFRVGSEIRQGLLCRERRLSLGP
jgi:hypothetical protein